MPNYGTPQAGGTLTELKPGDSLYLFNAETPAAPQASIAFARGTSPSGDDGGVTFQILFAEAPTAELEIQASDVDTDADYITLTTLTNIQQGSYTDTQRFAFYRAKLVSQSAGGAVTVLAQR